MQVMKVNSYSQQFKGLSPWKSARVREKAKKAQEEYIRKTGSSRLSPLKDERIREKMRPEHPDPWNLGWEDNLKECRKFANGLKRPDPSLNDYEERLADWKEYSKYRTKK